MARTIFYHRERRMDYPIGENIQHNLPNIKSMAACIAGLGEKNICLCCRGSSGAIIAGLVVGFLPSDCVCTITHIKKPGEDSHRYGLYIPDNAYIIIIDDFISTGNTICAIYSAIYHEYPSIKIDCLCLDSKCTGHKINFEYDTLIVGTYEKVNE